MSKKIFIGLTSFFLLFVVALPVHGGLEAEIREDLKEIRGRIQQLIKDVESLMEGEEHLVKATFPRIPDDFRFRTHMRFRDYLVDVKYMQIILNADPETRLIESGVGSPGNEVERFGNLTRNALMKFQQKYAEEILYPWGITEPTGIAEIQTLKKLNKILDGEVVIKVIDPDKKARIKKEIMEIAQKIAELRRKIDEYEDVEEGAHDAPTNVRGAIIGYGEVRLTWKGHKDAEYFTAYIANRSGGYRELYGDTTRTSGIVSGLRYGETYYLTVTQTVDGRESGHSREVRITMDWEPTPFKIRGEATDIGEITLTWETDQSGVEEYYIYRGQKDPGGPYTIIAASDTESFTDTGLDLYTIYYYVVTQIIDGVESDFSAEYIDSWFYNWRGGRFPHPEKEAILDNLDYEM